MYLFTHLTTAHRPPMFSKINCFIHPVSKTTMYLYLMLICLSLVHEFNTSNTCDCEKSNETSLYEQYCCPHNNRGKTFIVPSAGKVRLRKYILCPPETPSSCFTDFFSCSDILTKFPSATSGYYNIELTNGSTVSVYCDMEGVNCDGEGGWMRVAYLNMSDPTEDCPQGFNLYEVNGTRACGRQSSGCQSVKFPSHNISYSQVCGRVIGYQKGSPDAVAQYLSNGNIDGEYVDGVSLTRGSPRQHIWTFIAALQENSFAADGVSECPCAPNSPVSPPSFVGNDYFCESGNPTNWDSTTFHTADPLWDGKQCGLIEEACCNAPGIIPWFHKLFQQPTTDYIELRVCGDQEIGDEDAPVGSYEMFVK